METGNERTGVVIMGKIVEIDGEEVVELMDWDDCHRISGKECKHYECYFNHEGLCAIRDIDFVG